MSKAEQMIVPTHVKPLRNVKDTIKVSCRVVDGNVLERVLYEGREARVYREHSDILLRTHFANKNILSAFYHDFGVHSHTDPYLCIASCDELKVVSLERNVCQTIDLPIKIQSIFSTTLGLLLVRADNDDSDVVRGPGMLFSLSHPYGELLAVLCKFKGEDKRPFIYIKQKVEFVTSLTPSNLLMGHATDDNVNYLFVIRTCTDDEKASAKTHLHETMPPSPQYNSPASPSTFELGRSITRIDAADTALHTPTGGRLSWKERYRSPRGTSGSARLSRSQLTKSRADSTASRLLADLSQQTTHSTTFDHTSILSEITGEAEADVDHNAVEWTLECVWSDDVRRPGGVRSPSRLPIFSHSQGSVSALKRSNRSRTKVEKAISEQLERGLCLFEKPSTSFMTTDLNERVFVVYAIPEKNVVNVLRVDLSKRVVNGALTTVQAAHAAPLLGTPFWVCSRGAPVDLVLYSGATKLANLALTCVLPEAPDLYMSQLLQIVCRSGMQFEMVVNFSPTLESSPSKEPSPKKQRSGLGSPRKRVQADWPLSKPTARRSLRFEAATGGSPLRCSESQPTSSTLYVSSPNPKLLTFDESPLSISHAVDLVVPRATARPSPTNCRVIEVRMNNTTTTAIGARVYAAMVAALSAKSRPHFVAEWLCYNAHRIVRANYSRLVECELALLLKLFFAAQGINAQELPFVKAVNSHFTSAASAVDAKRCKVEPVREDSGHTPALDLFVHEMQGSQNIEASVLQQAEVDIGRSSRSPILNADEVADAFAAIHRVYEALRRESDRCARVARAFLAEPLYIFAAAHGLGAFVDSYVRVAPALSQLVVFAADGALSSRVAARAITPGEECDVLRDVFGLETLVSVPLKSQPLLTRTQYNKLKALPTQAEIRRWVILRWPSDIRVYNIGAMLDATKPILIPDFRSSNVSDGQMRDVQEKFLCNVALRTITRSFGAAFLNYHSMQAEPMEAALVDRICLNGRINPSDKSLDYPIPDQAPAKLVGALCF